VLLVNMGRKVDPPRSGAPWAKFLTDK